MKKGTIILISIVVVILLIGGCAGCSVKNTYNNAITQSEEVDSKWANVESQYQRRYDLIGNLVETVKGAADFEKSTLTDVISARAQAFQAKIDISNASEEDFEKYAQAQNSLGGTLSRLLVNTEAYPELKAITNFTDLQVQLEGTENRINIAREDYNTAAKGFNTTIKRFPFSLFNSILGFGFTAKPYFKSVTGADKAPEVDFSKEKE